MVEMAGREWRRRFRGVPIVGGIVEMLGVVLDVYDAIGWTDSTYRIGTGEERLTEARKVAEAGSGRGEADEAEGLSALATGQENARERDRAAGQGDG
jgi:hypothetical protein